MRHFYVKDADGVDTGSWSANTNGENKILAQITDTKGSQSRATLDVIDATILVQHLLSACQSVIKPGKYPRQYSGRRSRIKRDGRDVEVEIYDDNAGDVIIVVMTLDDATDFASKLVDSAFKAQRKANAAFDSKA